MTVELIRDAAILLAQLLSFVILIYLHVYIIIDVFSSGFDALFAKTPRRIIETTADLVPS